MLRELFKAISTRDSPYHNIYYLTDTEVRFSINDDRIGRVITISVRNEGDKYMAYGFEKSQIQVITTTMRQSMKEVKNLEDFWKWFNYYCSDMS
jgi:hypothetical protein